MPQTEETQNSDTTQVALFPIPNVVAFPGNDLPLHVFEPRYRKLIHDCIEARRMVGVCHTVKAISTPAKQQSVEEMLGSNQATYKPIKYSPPDTVKFWRPRLTGVSLQTLR